MYPHNESGNGKGNVTGYGNGGMRSHPTRPALRCLEVEPGEAGQATPSWGPRGGQTEYPGDTATRQSPEPPAGRRHSMQTVSGQSVHFIQHAVGLSTPGSPSSAL